MRCLDQSNGNVLNMPMVRNPNPRPAVALFLLIELLLSVVALAAKTEPATPEPIDAGKTTANVFESSFFHFRYELPKGWSALADNTRLAENNKRYRDAMSEPSRPNDPNSNPITDAYVPYNMLFAARTAIASGNEKPLPRVQIQAIHRGSMVREAGDPAKIYIKMARPKILRDPEEVVISGRKFSRADFQLLPGSFLSQFVTESGDYIIEFDLRAGNEKDLADLVGTMQSVQFAPR